MRKGLSWMKKMADIWLLQVFLRLLLLALVRKGRLAGDCWWSSLLSYFWRNLVGSCLVGENVPGRGSSSPGGATTRNSSKHDSHNWDKHVQSTFIVSIYIKSTRILAKCNQIEVHIVLRQLNELLDYWHDSIQEIIRD